ncbi:alcohol dehydrogenase catalytic domain-containing protein [Thermotoga sp. KOL6]|uniref:alcohol dehydrogenase catalytic domain-containing protein n=1 Tax=Thermotoga sp. KOL6 TaxID=126741 RepID=UPI000C77D511|nr:alcohol dehydrogenase catalytic domain-containing protein [Thermotoga sp. KOL6]PLV59040.1 alcohol dehydrogenase [Thermotoga sp. KOL6]
MKSLFIERPKSAKIVEAEIPSPQKGQALVKVLACGICGTDYKIFSGETEAIYPIVPGHEIVGIVESSEIFERGQMVVIDPNRSCGKCDYCKKGKPNLCENLRATGVTETGGFSEYVLVEENQIYPVEKIPAERAVFAEPLSCVLHGVKKVKHESFDRILIVGAGAIGTMFGLIFKKIFPGAEIVLVERNSKRAQFVAQTFDLKVEEPRGFYELTVECSGSIDGFELCFNHLRVGGTLLLFSVISKDKTSKVSPFEIYKKELKILGSYLNPFIMKDAVRMIESNEFPFEKLVTDRVNLEGVKSYLETHKKALMKGVFIPG